MREIILIKNGEIALKGLNRGSFEDLLVRNIRRRIKPLGSFIVRKAQSAIYVEPESEDIDLDEALSRIKKVFGIAVISKALVVEKDLNVLIRSAAEYLKEKLSMAKTFKVEAKRADKRFPFPSPEICREAGAYLLKEYPNLSVDVHNPELTVTLEVRDFGAYVHSEKLPGAGGMPVGSGGKAMLLLSGGIDSPVAGYMMAKRGLAVSAVHFESPPYTSERARLKVESLCEKMTGYMGEIPFFCVHFTEIQEAIRRECPEELFTVIMRRMMMRIAQRVAVKNGQQALITGESLGQVASQTLSAMACTDAVCGMPVFRPLIGMDKSEIVEVAQKIDTFEISIQPYDDCCTVFTPKHPRTHPSIELIEKAESVFDFSGMIHRAVEGTTRQVIS